MGKIRQLDSQTTNLIAAGEVVERPMGVVKELVENAIDASSTRITIAIEEGGLKKITITDNGTGMDSADAEMCFQRHATSKIHGQNDLWTIHTLGFRGEALPSIAAVAKVTLTTSNGEDATRVVMAYGKTESVSPYPCSKGTEIQVEGLFYHTPARLKHMRSASYEASLIQDVISRFALSHPEIAFRFINEGRDAFRTSGQGSLQEVVYSVYGRGAAENAIPVDFSDFDYHVHGYLIAPSITRATRNMMHIFLNGRMVKTYKLYQSVQEGYHEFIPKGRCPMCVLLVEMDPHLLDVNVHPSKWEVRISKEGQLEVLIKDQVEKALKEKGAVRESAEAEDKPARTTYYQPLSFDDLDLRAAYPSAGSGYKSHKQTVEKEETAETTDKKETDQNTTAITGLSHLDPDTQAAIRKEAEEDNALLAALQAKVEEKEETYGQEQEEDPFPLMEIIGQYKDTHILASCSQGLVIISQKRAQERILYEQLAEKIDQETIMNDLLVPVTIQTSDDIVRRIDELNETYAPMHIQFEAFGKDTVSVRSIPAWMQKMDETLFLQDCVDLFVNEQSQQSSEKRKQTLLKEVSMHTVHVHQKLNMEEMKELIARLAMCHNRWTDPQGNPTLVIMDEKKLLKGLL